MEQCPCLTIMPYCINRTSDACVQCAREGKYRHFEPEVLNEWEIPGIPPFSELLKMDGYAKLAVMYLLLHWLMQQHTRNP